MSYSSDNDGGIGTNWIDCSYHQRRPNALLIISSLAAQLCSELERCQPIFSQVDTPQIGKKTI